MRILGEMTDITRDVLARFRWVDGHADVWRLVADAAFFPALVRALADPYRDSAISKVVGIEARGFILGGAVAIDLDRGFVAIRKPGGLFPGEKLEPSHLRTTETSKSPCGYNASRSRPVIAS
jgi:adenine/guanine phosphoribosyltransferase-like PRPP-binding protein